MVGVETTVQDQEIARDGNMTYLSRVESPRNRTENSKPSQTHIQVIIYPRHQTRWTPETHHCMAMQ